LPAILYADITAPQFKTWHSTLTGTAKSGKTSYRIRHKPSIKAPGTPLLVNGYGVELQLKRTDYIVIDDRQKEEGQASNQKPLGTGLDEDEDVADLKPLSKEEVSDLGLKAASFVMKSDQRMDTLLKLVQDFPKYSSIIAGGHNISEDFLEEHTKNRELLLPTGINMIWINGIQIPARDVNPYSLLAHLRRERSLVNGIRSQGLSAPDVVALLSHEAISATQTEDEPQRYDFRDELEGGNVIIYMNNIEKDSRYESWPTELRAVRHTRRLPELIANTTISCYRGCTRASFPLSAVTFIMQLFLSISRMLLTSRPLSTLS
jgi:UDP-glucose:glycoprotein glucosyltransferase